VNPVPSSTARRTLRTSGPGRWLSHRLNGPQAPSPTSGGGVSPCPSGRASDSQAGSQLQQQPNLPTRGGGSAPPPGLCTERSATTHREPGEEGPPWCLNPQVFDLASTPVTYKLGDNLLAIPVASQRMSAEQYARSANRTTRTRMRPRHPRQELVVMSRLQ
jgi:hypothetical protein